MFGSGVTTLKMPEGSRPSSAAKIVTITLCKPVHWKVPTPQWTGQAMIKLSRSQQHTQENKWIMVYSFAHGVTSKPLSQRKGGLLPTRKRPPFLHPAQYNNDLLRSYTFTHWVFPSEAAVFWRLHPSPYFLWTIPHGYPKPTSYLRLHVRHTIHSCIHRPGSE